MHIFYNTLLDMDDKNSTLLYFIPKIHKDLLSLNMEKQVDKQEIMEK